MVVDDPARLLDDRPADRLHPGGPTEAGRRGLEDAQLGREAVESLGERGFAAGAAPSTGESAEGRERSE